MYGTFWVETYIDKPSTGNDVGEVHFPLLLRILSKLQRGQLYVQWLFMHMKFKSTIEEFAYQSDATKNISRNFRLFATFSACNFLAGPHRPFLRSRDHFCFGQIKIFDHFLRNGWHKQTSCPKMFHILERQLYVVFFGCLLSKLVYTSTLYCQVWYYILDNAII